MNYIEHHIGDYLKKTAHLTALEDGIYRRLLDRYYTTEAPLPGDVRECCKLARATTKSEREAVQSVLSEFFSLQEDGYHQSRADEEIAKYQAKTPDREAKRDNDAERQRRARERRKALFEQLRKHGIVPPFDTKTATLQAMVDDVTGDDSSRERHAPVTRDNTANQSPVTSHQTPDLIPDNKGRASTSREARASDPVVEGHAPTAAGLACRAMKSKGLSQVNPGDPRLTALLDQGATIAEFEGIAAEAVEKRKGFAWVLTVLQNRRAEAAGIALAQPSAARQQPAETPYQRSMRERIESFAPDIAAKAPGQTAAPITLENGATGAVELLP